MPVRAIGRGLDVGEGFGRGWSQCSSTAAYSAAHPWRPISPWFEAQTRSPGFTRVTPEPTASTVPPRSLSMMYGSVSGIATRPDRT